MPLAPLRRLPADYVPRRGDVVLIPFTVSKDGSLAGDLMHGEARDVSFRDLLPRVSVFTVAPNYNRMFLESQKIKEGDWVIMDSESTKYKVLSVTGDRAWIERDGMMGGKKDEIQFVHRLQRTRAPKPNTI